MRGCSQNEKHSVLGQGDESPSSIMLPVQKRLARCGNALLSRFSSNPSEFFRVGNDANCLNTPLLDFNAQNEDSLSANADDQRGLAVDLGHLRLKARWWHKALASSHAKACHRLTPSKRARGRSFDLPAPIGPQRHIFGEQVHQGGYLTGLHRLEVPVEQLPMGFGRGAKAWPMLTQMELRPAERAATGRFTLVKHRGNLGEVVLEDFPHQEDGSLKRLELLQEHQECQRNRFMLIYALLRVYDFGSICREDRLW